MCTALSFNTKDHYFGRNLDLDCSYNEEVCVMPRNFPLEFRKKGRMENHCAIIGMATVVEGTPLFYDATNEYGLSMAGLNFPGNAYYHEEDPERCNITPFELIPWILGSCKRVMDAKEMLCGMNLVNIPFSEKLPLSPLHWIISDKYESITVEPREIGLCIYENPVGVLTNNPPFDYHIFNLNNYRNLKVDNGENTFIDETRLENYCMGLGAVGLPGDVSSMSRFVRAVFTKSNSVCDEDEESSVNQFFHLLTSVEMVKGCCKTENRSWDMTVYSSCTNTDKGLYYYITYNNRQINCVDMHKTDLESSEISRFPLIKAKGINYQN